MAEPDGDEEAGVIELLRWQFHVAWSLADEVHLPRLSDELCHWCPTPLALTVRPDAFGRWRPDWPETEPDPPQTASVGWLTWHLIWWWTEVSAVLAGQQAAGRAGVDWPGSAAAAVGRLRALAVGWNQLLDSDPDLDVPIAYPWSDPRPARYTLAWVNAELMKNVAEIGAVHHLWAASRDPG